MPTQTEESFLLQNLPVELIEVVISFIHSPKTLGALTQTSQKLRQITGSKLYDSVLITRNSGNAFAEAIDAKPELKDVVREVVVDCDIAKIDHSGDVGTRSACALAPLFSTFENLEVLSLHSGYWHRDDRDEQLNCVKWDTHQEALMEAFD